MINNKYIVILLDTHVLAALAKIEFYSDICDFIIWHFIFDLSSVICSHADYSISIMLYKRSVCLNMLYCIIENLL